MSAEFKIRLAGQCIEIHALHPYIKEYCRDYLTDEAPDFSVIVSQKDIDFEREKSAREDELEGRSVRHFADDYLETLAAYRKIAERLPDYDTLLFHGSVIAVDGEGYLFTAKSGTGKSTHAALWREVFGERAVMVNDDKPLLKITDTGIIAYGTPWNGKHRLSRNISVPLRAICILERAQENRICRAEGREVYPLLLQQCYRPEQPETMIKTLTLLDTLINNAKLYRLGCNMQREAAITAYNGMRGFE